MINIGIDKKVLVTEDCYACRSTSTTSRSDCEGFVHLVCGVCHLMRLHSDYFIASNNFYTESYFNGQMFRATYGKYGYPNCYADLSTTYRTAHYNVYINKIVSLFEADQIHTLKALDFGCGYGYFLKTLVEKTKYSTRVEVSGIELDTEVCAKARMNCNGAPIYCVDLKTDDSIVPRNYFDIITMIDVLEHLDDPRVYLQRLAERAKSNAYLLLSTPNIESFNAWLYQDRWALHSPPYHMYYFGPRSIRILLEQTGWRIIDLYTERTIFHNERSGMETWRGRIASALFQNSVCDAITNRFFKIGSIMIVIAKRS